jgi:hypothetical protein
MKVLGVGDQGVYEIFGLMVRQWRSILILKEWRSAHQDRQ